MKTAIFIILFLFLVSSVYALDCKYTKTEEYYETERVLVYEGTEVRGGEDLKFSGFSEGNIASFVIQNPNTFTVMVILNYTIKGTGEKNTQYGQWISPGSEIQVRHVCRDGETFGICSIDKDSLSYHVEKPKVMYPDPIKVKKIRLICDGKDDGTVCESDYECGSKVCNFAKYCGEFIICPANTTNCNNVSCTMPSTKEVGESYQCEWECVSGEGREGVCKNRGIDTLKNILGLIGGFTVIVGVSFFLYRRGMSEKEQMRIAENIERLNNELFMRMAQLKNLEREGHRSEKQLWEIKENIQKLKDSSNKKEELEKELKRKLSYEKQLKDTNERIHRLKDAKSVQRLKEDLDEGYKNQIISRFGENRVEIEKGEYPKFKRGTEIHRWFYKGQYAETYNLPFDEIKIVHHIDVNKWNSLNFWNLIDLTVEQHERIVHSKINKGDWMGGIKVLMEALHWTEKNLPRHIQQHLKKK